MFFFFEDGVVPSFEQMIKPVMIALQQLGGHAKVSDLDSKTIKIMNIPQEIAERPHKGAGRRTEVAYRMAWARTYLKKYGLIENTVRGRWSFTDKVSGNIGDIDTNQIVQAVRRGNTKVPAMSGIENAAAFEQLVVSVIKDTVNRQGKSYYLSLSSTVNFGCDMRLPEGIDSIEGDVYCIIKYAQTSDRNFYSVITKAVIRAMQHIKSGTLLLIIGRLLGDDERQNIKKQISDVSDVNVVIWDVHDVYARVEPESDDATYLINPRQALIDHAILSEPTDEERAQSKAVLIERVKVEYRRENLTLFLGAGVSIDAGIPQWETLVRKLHIHMIGSKLKGRKLNERSIEKLNTLAYSKQGDSPIAQMRHIKTGLAAEEYHQIVHEELYSSNINTRTKLLDAIADICKPQRAYNGIKSIVTYNFDNLVEQNFTAKKVGFHSVYRDIDMPSLEEINIYHVHGYLPQLNNIAPEEANLIFSEEDYHQMYHNVYSWSNLTQLNALRDSTCLFIGSSFTDPNLRRLLDVASRNAETARHFAIMRKNLLPPNGIDEHILQTYQGIDINIKEQLYCQLGLNIIWVDDYDEIPQVLLKLLDR
ncbi:MAG: SIR2 family protein [Oscillospiraceae bacterium]|nr:SIR2 family protein [Oscillospiraceae bacterium]